MTERKKLTKSVVDSVQPREAEYLIWDTEIPGFGCRIRPGGSKTFLFKYRVYGGRKGTPRKPKIGTFGEITAHRAREIAKDWSAQVAHGGDPGGERKAARDAETISDLWDIYQEKVQKAPRSLAEDKRNMRLHIRPELGGKKVIEIQQIDVERLVSRLHDRPGAARKCLALLSHMLNRAEKWGYRPLNSNPCRHVERPKMGKRERFLTERELARLATAISNADESPYALAAIRLLLFTGCRRSEILGLRWVWIDFERACLRLPTSKTGAKVVYLNAPALSVLSSIKRIDGNPYVIAGRKDGSHITDVKGPWQRIRAEAGLDDVRLHDLRHSFASAGAAAGLSLQMIGKMLGHTQASTTERYSHLADDPVKAAVEQVGARIDAAMQGKKGEVVDVGRRKGRVNGYSAPRHLDGAHQLFPVSSQ